MDFFHEKPVLLKKNEKCYFIFYNKNSHTCQFRVFTIKNDFENMSVSNELDLKIALSELFEFTHRLVFTEIFYFKKITV